MKLGGRSADAALVILFAVASFISAGLLFLVEPMVGKLVLPLFGGSPAVWNTTMLFFQAALLAGYLYAHVSVRFLGLRRQPMVHFLALLLPLAVLPVGLPAWSRPPQGVAPAFWLLWVLLVMVGAPFLVVSTTAPLLQRWFSATRHPRAGDPYFLYAAGNAGSLLALVAYPSVVEPTLSLAAQGWMWAAGYVVFVLLVGSCALVLLRAEGVGTATVETEPVEAEAVVVGAMAAPAAVGGGGGEARPRGGGADPDAIHVPASGVPLGLGRQLWWVALAFVPSSLMLGVTAYISTDIAAFPLLWVIPLALYLLTFIVAFGQPRPRLALAAGRLLPMLMLGVGLHMVGLQSLPIAVSIPLHLVTFTCLALVAHGRLAADRPEPSRLTQYYLLVSLGGVLGGIFNALIAPVAFNDLVEYPLVLAVSLFVVGGWSQLWGRFRSGAAAVWQRMSRGADEWVARRQREAVPEAADGLPVELAGGPPAGGWRSYLTGWLPLREGRWQWALRAAGGLVLVAVLLFLKPAFQRSDDWSALAKGALLLGVFGVVGLLAFRRPFIFAVGMAFLLGAAVRVAHPNNLETKRTFFGVKYVNQDSKGRHVLINGTTLHGWEDRRPEHIGEPQTYYHRDGPLGQIMTTYGALPVGRRMAMVGLGTGSLAAYGQPGQDYTFYEIDQAVVDIARDPTLFSFVSDSKAKVNVVLGDGRLTLADAPDHTYGVIVLDAFSSDAIPVHLLTSEAVELYRRKLAPGGVIAFHISNRHLSLERVLAGIAEKQQLAAMIAYDNSDEETGKLATTVVAVAEKPEDLTPLRSDKRWLPLELPPERRVAWTDDFSNVLRVITGWR